MERTKPTPYERQVSRQQGGYSKLSTTPVLNDSCVSPRSMEPDKEPPHERRKSMVSLQPIQQLWTACPCKIFGKVRESLHVGSADWAIRLRSVLGSLRSYGGRAALLVTPFLVSCLHALGGIVFTSKIPFELCRRAALAPFVAARISYLESKQKRQPPGWLLTLSDREPSCVLVHRCRLLFFSSLL